MMMSLNEPQRQALGSIEDGLAGSDPRLASMLNIFSRLAADEEMPVREKIRVQRGRTAAHRRRRARWHPRRGIALPQARRRYPRLGWQQAMLLLWVVISAALVAVALVLNTSGHKACIPSMGTACPSRPVPQHADASHLMKPRLLAEAFRRDSRQAAQSFIWTDKRT
jgi:hypothetical protein